MEPRALDELIEVEDIHDCQLSSCKEESLKFLTETKSYNIPSIITPPVMHNKGNFIISLGSLCKWLSQQAENLGVEIYPGFAASELIVGITG